MDVLKRIVELRMERGWTEYRLSEESDIPQSTISSWYRKGAAPTINSIEKICGACRITMSQFFDEENEIKDEQKKLVKLWSRLTEKQREVILELLETM